MINKAAFNERNPHTTQQQIPVAGNPVGPPKRFLTIIFILMRIVLSEHFLKLHTRTMFIHHYSIQLEQSSLNNLMCQEHCSLIITQCANKKKVHLKLVSSRMVMTVFNASRIMESTEHSTFRQELRSRNTNHSTGSFTN
jgi:hypothetical protein